MCETPHNSFYDLIHLRCSLATSNSYNLEIFQSKIPKDVDPYTTLITHKHARRARRAYGRDFRMSDCRALGPTFTIKSKSWNPLLDMFNQHICATDKAMEHSSSRMYLELHIPSRWPQDGKRFTKTRSFCISFVNGVPSPLVTILVLTKNEWLFKGEFECR